MSFHISNDTWSVGHFGGKTPRNTAGHSEGIGGAVQPDIRLLYAAMCTLFVKNLHGVGKRKRFTADDFARSKNVK